MAAARWDRACEIQWVTPSRPLGSTVHALLCSVTWQSSIAHRQGLEGYLRPNCWPDNQSIPTQTGVRLLPVQRQVDSWALDSKTEAKQSILLLQLQSWLL